MRVVPYVDLDQRFPAALERNDYATAGSILDRAAWYGRDSAVLRLQLANQLSRTRNPMPSLRHYRRSLELRPRAEGYANLAGLVERLQGLEAALFLWREGVARFPEDPALLRGAGLALVRAGRASEAVPILERAVEAQPDDPIARRGLALARDQSAP